MNKDTWPDQELDKVILLWLGWRHLKPSGLMIVNPGWRGIPPGQIGGNPIRSPEFCKDLNAIHWAEKSLPSYTAMRAYEKALKSMPRPDDYGIKVNRVIYATARQRAEALVHVIEEGMK